MIRPVARTEITCVNRFVIGMLWRQRTEPYWCQQFALGHVDDRFPTPFVQDWMIEGYREQLVRPARRIISLPAVHVDHVVKVPALFEPEALVERCARLLGMLVVTVGCLGIAALAQPALEET